MTLWVFFIYYFIYTMFAKHIFIKKKKKLKDWNPPKMQLWATDPVNKDFFTLQSFFLSFFS